MTEIRKQSGRDECGLLSPAKGATLLEDDSSAAPAVADRYARAALSETDESYGAARERLLWDFERGYLKWLVGRSGGSMSKAARIAGVDHTTLYRLMERHRLCRDVGVTDGSSFEERTVSG